VSYHSTTTLTTGENPYVTQSNVCVFTWWPGQGNVTSTISESQLPLTTLTFVASGTTAATARRQPTLWEMKRQESRDCHHHMCREAFVRRGRRPHPRRRTHQQPKLRGVR
jgi:hypothetical protein